MENEVLKFLEVYSKTMQSQNKYVSENTWNAYKLILAHINELDELKDEVKELKKEIKKHESSTKN